MLIICGVFFLSVFAHHLNMYLILQHLYLPVYSFELYLYQLSEPESMEYTEKRVFYFVPLISQQPQTQSQRHTDECVCLCLCERMFAMVSYHINATVDSFAKALASINV